MTSHLNFKENIVLVLLFILFFLISLLIYKDYGISIDEDSTRHHGLVSFNYIKILLNNSFNLNLSIDNNLQNLKNYEYKTYGVFFELLVLSLENLFSINDYRDIYYFRHLATHFFFILATIFLIKIIYRNFANIYLALWGGICFYTTPRIFAHSFFNNKDIIFLSFFTISLYFVFKYLKKKKNNNLIFCCLSMAILTSTRVIGLYFFLIFLLFLIFEILDNKKNKTNIFNLIKIVFFYFLFVYLTWPYLWASPINNFLLSLFNMANYPWGGLVFYLGEYHNSFYLPWHYLFVWIISSSPSLIIIIFFISFSFFLIRLLKRIIHIDKIKETSSLWKSHKELFSYLNLILIIFPLAVIIFNNSTVYTGWRHIYFVYPSMILLSVSYISILQKKFFRVKKNNFLVFFLLLVIGVNLFSLYKYHPYQNNFFNIFFENKANKLFEIDYWGSSNKEALTIIAGFKNNSNVCNLGLLNLYQSKKMLKEELKSKININGQKFDECDIIVSNKIFISDPKYTKKYQLPKNFNLFHTIERGNVIINRIYKRQ
tara:strand:- start:206 stop:1831 length:1626 start_codon:yes stop_codon:yes gene_type:complete